MGSVWFKLFAQLMGEQFPVPPITGFARTPWTIHAVSRQWHMKMTERYTEHTTKPSTVNVHTKQCWYGGMFLFAFFGKYCILFY